MMDSHDHCEEPLPNKNKPAIARRSCDSCRTRKIGCDRASPCSNCTSARLNCTHSTVASNAKSTKQRVMISTKYEEKINGIAKDIDEIKLLLERLDTTTDAKQARESPSTFINSAVDTSSEKPPVENYTMPAPGDKPSSWSYSAHIVDLIRDVVNGESEGGDGPERSEVISSLRNLVQALEKPPHAQELSLSSSRATFADNSDKPLMPPLDAAVAILRWARDHEADYRIAWISHILPLETFANTCKKVYFVIEDYTQVDFIIANGYLSHIFSEHFAISGRKDYQEYGEVCRKNLQEALSRLPLLLPPSMEVTVALALGTLNAIENSNTTAAWTFVSMAASMCQTLKLHSYNASTHDAFAIQATQRRLFWTVYRFEKGLALRLGRSSNIRDSDITLPLDPNEPRQIKLGRIQGKAYDELYSPAGLLKQNNERGDSAAELAGQLRTLIDETRAELYQSNLDRDGTMNDPMRAVYLQFDVICQSSLLTQILRAVPDSDNSQRRASNEYLTIAHETLDMHELFMTDVYGRERNPYMVKSYISWAILHVPFVPFSIIFTQAVQFYDFDELIRLEKFANSMKPKTTALETSTHPYRLYDLLCQAARLHIERGYASVSLNPTLAEESVGGFNLGHFDTRQEVAALNDDTTQLFGLDDWYYGNQQMMDLLNHNVTF